MANFKQGWDERSVDTPAGRLEWTEFPGKSAPFVGCSKLAGQPISIVEAHLLLVEVEHPAAGLDYLGSRSG